MLASECALAVSQRSCMPDIELRLQKAAKIEHHQIALKNWYVGCVQSLNSGSYCLKFSHQGKRKFASRSPNCVSIGQVGQAIYQALKNCASTKADTASYALSHQNVGCL